MNFLKPVKMLFRLKRSNIASNIKTLEIEKSPSDTLREHERAISSSSCNIVAKNAISSKYGR